MIRSISLPPLLLFDCFVMKRNRIFHPQSTTIALFVLALIWGASASHADTKTQIPVSVHGPICVWHDDPLTKCSVVWIEHPQPRPKAWFAAQAGFGYGDEDDATLLDMRNKERVLCIRHSFKLKDHSKVDSLELDVLYDDGFVAFLNGHEVVRANVTGDINADEIKQLKVKSHEAEKSETFAIKDPKRGLRNGENILALVGLNTKLASTDFSLHPSLNGTTSNGKVAKLIKRNSIWQAWLGAPPSDDWMTSFPDLSENKSDFEDKDWTLEMRYCRKGSNDWQAATIERRPMPETTSTIATASIKGLQPGTEYQVELMGALAGETLLKRALTMKTAPQQRPELMRFVNGGDMFHTRELLDAMNRQAGKLDPMFALLGGDLAYANARDSGRWYQWFDSWYENAVTEQGRQIPMIAVIGNHETKGMGPDHARFYYSLFPLPQGRSNFAVDFGDYMSIVNLDSAHSQPVSNQTQWLDSTLQQRKDRPILFACYHRPTYGTLVKEDNTAVRTQWVPLFEDCKVDAVFEHDHHVFKRSLPIYQGNVDDRRGVLYMGDGAWGVRVRKIPEQHGENLPYIQSAHSRNHLIHVLIDETEIHYHATEADGSVFDKYSRKH